MWKAVMLGFLAVAFASGAPVAEEKANVQSIPGTGLYTGIWYTFDNVAKAGRMEWALKQMDTGYYHVQIDTAGFYQDVMPGGKYYIDAQWMMVPSPEAPGWYLLRNRNIPDAAVTYAQDSTAGKWMVVGRNDYDTDNYKVNGIYRNDALWKFEENDKNGKALYNIYNKAYPKSGLGLVTWSGFDVGYPGKYYLQIEVDNTVNKDDKDYLWDIQPTEPIPQPKKVAPPPPPPAPPKLMCCTMDVWYCHQCWATCASQPNTMC